MFTLFARAAHYASLTPAERAFLRLLEGFAYAGLLGAATACAQYLAGHPGAPDAVNWQPVLQACAAGAAVAVLMALAKYFKAHGDPALGGALQAAGEQLQQSQQVGQSGTDASADAQAATSAALVAAESVPGGAADSATAS